MCDLTTKWILESAQSLACALIYLGSGELIDDPLGEGSNASSTSSELWRAENSFSEWERTQRSEGSGMLIDDPL